MELNRPPSIESLHTVAGSRETQVSLYATDSPDVINPENGYWVEELEGGGWRLLFGVPDTGGVYQDQIWENSVAPGNPKRLTEGNIFMSPGFRNRLAFRDLPKPIEVIEVTLDSELNETDFAFYGAALVAFHTAPDFKTLEQENPHLEDQIQATRNLVKAIETKCDFPGDETSQLTNFIKQIVAKKLRVGESAFMFSVPGGKCDLCPVERDGMQRTGRITAPLRKFEAFANLAILRGKPFPREKIQAVLDKPERDRKVEQTYARIASDNAGKLSTIFNDMTSFETEDKRILCSMLLERVDCGEIEDMNYFLENLFFQAAKEDPVFRFLAHRVLDIMREDWGLANTFVAFLETPEKDYIELSFTAKSNEPIKFVLLLKKGGHIPIRKSKKVEAESPAIAFIDEVRDEHVADLCVSALTEALNGIES